MCWQAKQEIAQWNARKASDDPQSWLRGLAYRSLAESGVVGYSQYGLHTPGFGVAWRQRPSGDRAHAQEITWELEVEFRIYELGGAVGLPSPTDYGDLPLDFNSSTLAASQIIQGEDQYFLPRLSTYFDDMVGPDYCDRTGAPTAIRDFNPQSQHAKICRILCWIPVFSPDLETLGFAHADYCRLVGEKGAPSQMPRCGFDPSPQ